MRRDQVFRTWLQDLMHDVRFAARILTRERRFTAAAVVALALGIGVVLSMFAVVNMMLIRSLPFDRAERLISLQLLDRDGRPVRTSYAEFVEWRNGMSTFSGLAAAGNYAPMNLSEQGVAPERLLGMYVSSNTFSLLRTLPVVGRDFVPDDDRPGAAPVAILSDSVWEQRYRRDPSIVGRIVRIDAVPTVIIGVMPSRFKFPQIAQVWQPLAHAPAPPGGTPETRGLGLVFGRLQDDVDATRAREEFGAVSAQAAVATARVDREGIRGSVQTLRDTLIRSENVRPFLMTLMGAVTLVLLIACANVASLLLARSGRRSREIAIRASLGATRWRIVRQVLVECLVLAAVASALGFVLSLYGARQIAQAADPIQPGVAPGAMSPFFVDVSPDATMLLVTAVVCVGVMLLFGLLPAVHVARAGIAGTIGEHGSGPTVHAGRLTGGLIVAELALALVLLTGTSALWRGFYAAYLMDTVIDTDGLIAARIALPIDTYPSVDARLRFVTDLERRLAELPTVSAVTTASSVPLSPASPMLERRVEIEGMPAGDRPAAASYVYASPRYFDTLRLPMVRGRALQERDGQPGREVAVVDMRFVSRFFPNGEAVGRRIRVGTTQPGAPLSRWLTIVGVARTAPSFPAALAQPVVYAPIAVEPAPGPAFSLLVRSTASLDAIVPALREQVRALDADLPIFDVYTVNDAVAASRAPERMIGSWFTVIASIALILATLGVFAVTAQGAVERTREIGVRLALGARRWQVLLLFVRRLALHIGLGVALGSAGAWATVGLLRGYLVNTNPHDAAVFVGAATVLVTVAIAACLIPALRAANQDPVAALRHE
jgi:putative ABC transport system permease protein